MSRRNASKAYRAALRRNREKWWGRFLKYWRPVEENIEQAKRELSKENQ